MLYIYIMNNEIYMYIRYAYTHKHIIYIYIYCREIRYIRIFVQVENSSDGHAEGQSNSGQH